MDPEYDGGNHKTVKMEATFVRLRIWRRVGGCKEASGKRCIIWHAYIGSEWLPIEEEWTVLLIIDAKLGTECTKTDLQSHYN